MVVRRDIAERKRAEERQRYSGRDGGAGQRCTRKEECLMAEFGDNTRPANGLYRAIVGTTIALAFLMAALLLWGGPGPVLIVLPWFAPVIRLVQTLIFLSVGFLALGRYNDLRDPASFWIGMGAAGLGVSLAFHILTWPGLMPGGGSIITSLPSTPVWFQQLGITFFSTFLLAAVLVHWPRNEGLSGRRLHLLAAAWIVFLIIVSTLIVRVEQYLPTLITTTGVFTVLNLAWSAVEAILFAGGAVLSTRRYLQTGDTLLGYIAFAQTTFAFTIFATVSGIRRYDLWWYLLPAIRTGSTLIVLFGLLSENVLLFRREKERTAQALRAEDALRESEERFRALVTASSEVLYRMSPDWSEMRQLHSRGFLANTEKPSRTWLQEYIHPDDQPHVTAVINEAIRTKSIFELEHRVRRADGSLGWTFSRAVPLMDANGEIVEWFGAASDITDRKLTEEELGKYRERLEELVKERTIELEKRNALLQEEIIRRIEVEEEKKGLENQLIQTQKMEAIDRFAGGIAHDLNNILYPIIINTEMLHEEEPPDSDRYAVLDQTLKAAYRQRDLIRQILSFSRRSEQTFSPVKVVPLIEETIDFLRSTLPRTIDIHHHITTSADTVMGNSTQIQQVIMNLVQNAADSLESQKGIIEVNLMNTYLEPMHAHQEIQEGEYLQLTVNDTGSGIPSDILGRIFEPFFTTKEMGKGTGLGLSVAYGIVKNHGGAITVESESGKGTLFTVYLPVYEGESEVSSPSPSGEKAFSGKEHGNILLIDDEEAILSSLQRALKSSGYRVVAVKDGEKALQLFGNTPEEFDLVITDLTMPGTTGVELAGKIKEIRPDTPIILCTGFNDVIDKQKARSLGISELLLKPTGMNELKSAVGRALEH